MSFDEESTTKTTPTTISFVSSSAASNSIIAKLPQHKFYLNVTQEVPINYAIVLYGHITPILFTITITVNTLIVIVLMKRHMRTPTNSLLMSMALCDMCTILFPFPWFIYMYTLGNHFRPLASQTLCYAWTWMNEVIPATFHTASIWLTLSLAVQRYVYVCHPIAAKSFCTQANVSRTITWILVIAVLHQSTHFFDKNFIEETILWNNKTQTVCYVENSAWVHSLTVNVYYTLYYSFRVIFVHLIPCASLVILNCLLFNAMRKASKNHKNLLLGNKTPCSTSNGANCKSNNINNNNNNHYLDNMNSDAREASTAANSTCGLTNSSTGCGTSKKRNSTRKIRDTNRTTQMLIVVVIVFLLVEIPLAIVTILHIISSTICEILNYEFANKLILLTNFFIIASYPINFAIYCGMSKQFRQTFIAIFVPQRLRQRQQQKQRRRRQKQQEQQELEQQHSQHQQQQQSQTNSKRSQKQKKSLLQFQNQFGPHLDPSTAAFANDTTASVAEHSQYSYGAVTATTVSTMTTV